MTRVLRRLTLLTALAVPLSLCLSMALPVISPTAGGVAWAGDCDEQDDDGAGKFHVEERNGQKVYVIDKVITVCGKVPRPLVAYVLQPRNINYQWEQLKQDFLPKILQSVKKAPF